MRLKTGAKKDGTLTALEGEVLLDVGAFSTYWEPVGGILWLLLSILIDAPLMLFGGPMKMSISAYMADIGVTYLCIPVITWGLSTAFSQSAGK